MKQRINKSALAVFVLAVVSLLLGGGLLAVGIAMGCGGLLLMALLQLMGPAVALLLFLPLGKARELKPLPEIEGSKGKKLWKALPTHFGNLLRRMGNFWHARRDVLVAIALIGAVFAANYFFWTNLSKATGGLAYWMLIVVAVVFVGCVALEKICAHFAGKEDISPRWAAIAKNLKDALALSRLGLALTAVAMLLKLTGLFDAFWILRLLVALLFVYETVLLVLSVAIRLIRRELGTEPAMPLSFRAMGHSGVLTYLEENTGITMRSLWSMRLIRELLPAMALLVTLLVWVFSGVVQIEAHQEGALYRFGKLQTETLKPGLHLTLPWPIDTVDVYDTQSLRRVVVGYTPNGQNDNIWTESHGTEEYRLLLGGGNEMVSINLQVEYHIRDLNDYLRASASAESLLSAAAYEIVTARTIATDIDTLLSADRTVFSETFRDELERRTETYNLGIHVTDVVLESIHPPVEVARVYQNVISAGIRAEQIVLIAQQEAVLMKADAQLKANAEVSVSSMIKYQQLGEARKKVAEFVAAAEAYSEHPAAYSYYKYLTNLKDTYSQAVLILVGEGVDEGSLVIGDLQNQPNEDPFYIEPEVEEEYWEE